MEGEAEAAAAISETATAASAETTAEQAATTETLNDAVLNAETLNDAVLNAVVQNAETLNAAAEDLSFQWVYNLYDKPAGDAFYAQSIWNTLKDDERRAAIEYIKSYVKMRPNRQFRKNFSNFLQQRTWETEPLTDCRPAAVAPPAANGNVDSVSCQADSVDDSPQHSIDNHSNDSRSIDNHSIDNHSNDNHSIDSHERQVARGESQIEYVRRVFAQHGYDYDALLAYK